MENHGKTYSPVKPEPIEINDYYVYVNTDITPVTQTIDGVTSEEWEYNMVQYDKDEYIAMMQEKAAESELHNAMYFVDLDYRMLLLEWGLV